MAKKDIDWSNLGFGSIDQLQPFVENAETSEIMLWDLHEQIGTIDEVDLKIFDYV